MDLEIRPCASAEEARQAITPIGYYFGRSAPNEDQTEPLTRVLPAQRVYAAWEGGRAVGDLALFPFTRRSTAGGWPRPESPSPASCRLTGDGAFFGLMMRALLDACYQSLLAQAIAAEWEAIGVVTCRSGVSPADGCPRCRCAGIARLKGRRRRSPTVLALARSAKRRLSPPGDRLRVPRRATPVRELSHIISARRIVVQSAPAPSSSAPSAHRSRGCGA